MCLDSELLDLLGQIEDDDYRSHVLANYHLVSPRKDVVRVTVISDKFYSSTGDRLGRLFPLGHAVKFMDTSRQSARLLSSALRRAWMDLFRNYVENGDGKVIYV
jgi:hypothetical protein